MRAALDAFDAFLLVTGTDTMDECAFCLALLLDAALARAQKVLAVTGAMKPSDQPGCDGPSNLIEAAKVGPAARTVGRQAVRLVQQGGPRWRARAGRGPGSGCSLV